MAQSVSNDPVINNADLTKIFAEVGRGYGYYGITAEFWPIKPIDMRWSGVGNHSFEFQISHYLIGTPADVFRDIADNLFHTIGKTPIDYSERVKEYLSSDGFVIGARKLHLALMLLAPRTEMDHMPKHHDINEAIARIGARIGEPFAPDVWFGWSKSLEAFQLIRYATVPVWMDSDKVPEEVFDYCLYWLAGNMVGFGQSKMEVQRAMERHLSRYPDGNRLHRELKAVLMTHTEGLGDDVSEAM